MSEQTQIFTLKQVVSSIRKTIEERYQRLYWVKAEMHKLNKYPSGHCFPELLQKEDGKIVAEIRGTIWAHQFERINKRFIEMVKEPLKEDTTLLMQVKVSFHETYGLSLQIMDIDPNYALGELQRERQETLKKLQKEGLINANQVLDFPLLPKRVAIISADASKGLSDFMQVLEQNEWNYQFFTLLFPAYLQGDNAAESIIGQLNRIERVKEHFDIVVIVRGGGGEVGLSCYNNYELCRAVASFPIPVLTGIGHSTNLTVAEMVSYRNAITPTELGEFLIQAFHNFSVPLKDAVKQVKFQSQRILELANVHLARSSKSFSNASIHALDRERMLLDQATKGVLTASHSAINSTRESINRVERNTVNAGKLSIEKQRNRLRQITGQLPIFLRSSLQKEQGELAQLTQSVRLMDPINVLNRGYSITLYNGKTIGASNPVEVGNTISTRTATFTLESTVTENKKSDE